MTYIVNLYNLMDVDPLYKTSVSKSTLSSIKSLIERGEDVLLHAIMEVWNTDNIKNILNELGVETTLPNVTLVFEEALRYVDQPIPHFDFENAFFYNHGMMKTYSSQEVNGFNKTINLQTNKFLYLMGKPYKTHRIGILHGLYKHDLLRNAEWSFLYRNDWDQALTSCLPQISEQEYRKFIAATIRKLDDVDIYTAPNMYYYSGLPTDSSLYEKTSFSIISETNCDPISWTKFTTEKTWRTISNHHAFVTVAYEDTFDYLENLGIDTFQYAVKHNKRAMNKETNIQDIVRMTVENAEYLLSNISKLENRIHDSIISNYKVYLDRVTYCRSIVDPAIEDHVLTPYFLGKPLVEPTGIEPVTF